MISDAPISYEDGNFMIPSFASERLASAVRCMACGNEPLQQRLEGAYAEFHPLIPADFPEGLDKKYLDIFSRLTRNGSVRDTTSAMSDQEASGIAASIVDLFFAVVGLKQAYPVFTKTFLWSD